MTCKKCGEIRMPDDFNKGRYTCKYCDRKNAKVYKKKKLVVKRGLITRYLGKKCVVCGETRRKLLRSHEKYGNPHPNLSDISLKELKENCKSGRFVRVCARCHGKSGDLLAKGIDWTSAQHYIQVFMKTDPPVAKYAHQWAWEKFMNNNIRDKQLEFPWDIEIIPFDPTTEAKRILEEIRLYGKKPDVNTSDSCTIEIPITGHRFFKVEQQSDANTQVVEGDDENWEDSLDPELYAM